MPDRDTQTISEILSSAKSPDVQPPRIVHLLGGVQAIDWLDGTVGIGVDGFEPWLTIARPEYPKLYVELENAGLRPIGVQIFRCEDELNGLEPPFWIGWRTPIGLAALGIEKEWANVRSQAASQTDVATVDCAGKIVTYLRLLSHRLFELSNAYHSTLRSQWAIKRAPIVDRQMFSNIWLESIDAAVHAFMADAASMRDCLAEALWRLVMKRVERDVTTMTTFRKAAKNDPHPLVRSTLDECGPGGWIKNLSDLRNSITHVVPASRSHEHDYCELRTSSVLGSEIVALHYPFTTKDWSLRTGADRLPDRSTHEAAARAFETYRAFVATSGDALEFAWRTTGRLNELAEAIRNAAGLSAPMPVLRAKPGTLKRHRRI